MAPTKDFSAYGMLLFWLCLGVFPAIEASHVMYNLSAVSSGSVQQRYRTAYHFQPPKNWMNDPNGPMFYKGLYHLFYQYNPQGALWGIIVWEHAVSKDLIHWESLESAIVPSEWYDINGCWSGSVTFLSEGKPVILYTGCDNSSRQVQNMAVPKNASDPFLREWVKVPQNPIIVPDREMDAKSFKNASDRFLRKWVKVPRNPIIVSDREINATSFRDPTTAWIGPDGKWRILVGSKEDEERKGTALLYASKDFLQWEKVEHPLHSSRMTGMWECPDFYPVPVSGNHGLDASAVGSDLKHVLKVSLDDYKCDYYTFGTYLRDADRYLPDNTSVDNEDGLRYDYGKFYASKTFFENFKSRRILWGWINESDSVSDAVVKGWSGVQAIPRTVWLENVSRSQLLQWPVSEVESLRVNKTCKDNIYLESGSFVKIEGVNGAQVDVEVSFNLPTLGDAKDMKMEMDANLSAQQLCSQSQNAEASKTLIGPFGLLVLASNDLAERTAVFFRVGRYRNKMKLLMCSDQSRSSLQTDVDKTTYGSFVPFSFQENKSFSLRVLVDHSIVESFGEGGKTCMTSRVYPTIATGEDACTSSTMAPLLSRSPN